MDKLLISHKLESLLKEKFTKIAVLTGAGISKESGIPTFRDPDGLWAKFNPQELANMDAFLANPDLVWSWYEHRREILDTVKPNTGHQILVSMEEYFDDFTLVTQNVDGLHALAGSKNILELHGNILKSYCIQCGLRNDNVRGTGQNPSCTSCKGKMRPGVVWFGEMLPELILEKAFEKLSSANLVFSIGTQGAVYPAAALPQIGKQNDAYIVEINPNETDISYQFDEVFRGPSGEILPKIWQQIAQ